jgi:hypothetical protein
VSGLRPSPRVRAERLAQEVRRRELEERRAGMSAPELAWERALELAPTEELEELGRLEAPSLTQELHTLPVIETLQSMRALQERIMYRSAPTLAAHYRVRDGAFSCMRLRRWRRGRSKPKKAELPPPAREFGCGSDLRSKRGAQAPGETP